jgi:hypothetical protein
VPVGAIPASVDGVNPVMVLTAVLLVACSSSLPEPEALRQPSREFTEVPYPPPAALLELVPEPPRGRHLVWIDGSWAWRGRYYVWQRGGWIELLPDTVFAPWKFIYTKDGKMLFAESRWVRNGRDADPLPVVVPARTPPNEVTPEFQTAR